VLTGAGGALTTTPENAVVLQGKTPHPIFIQNGLNDVDSPTELPFAVKVAAYSNPWTLAPCTSKIWPIFGRKLSVEKCPLINNH